MKKVVIIGASSGIGRSLAEVLAKGGVKVGLGARREQPMRELKDKYPGLVEYEVLDVAAPDASEKIKRLIEKTGGVDIYFHAAGVFDENLGLEPERELKTIRINAGGFSTSLATAYRYFKENSFPGQIAAITSVAGTKGIGRMAAYSASKSFDQEYMVALEQLANEEGLDISFTDIRPGWVKTPLLDADRHYIMEMSEDTVLPQILKALIDKKRVAVIDWKWNLLVALWRLIPDALWVRMKVKMSEPETPLV